MSRMMMMTFRFSRIADTGGVTAGQQKSGQRSVSGLAPAKCDKRLSDIYEGD